MALRGCALAFIVGLLLLMVRFNPFIFIPAGQLWCEWRNGGEFQRNQARYESIVQAIAAKGIPPGESRYFAIDPERNLAALRPISCKEDGELFSRANETNLIAAHVHPGGRLVVTFRTYSMGHAGVYGLIYSSGPPAKGEIENSLGMDGRVAPVAPNWWRVSDYSQ